VNGTALRILAITHLFPHAADPQQGVFAARQLVGLQNNGAEVVVFYPVISVPRALGLIKPRWRDYTAQHTPLGEYGLTVIPVPWVRLTRGFGSCRWDGLMVYHAMKRQAIALHRQTPFDVVYGRGLFPGADAAARLATRLGIASVGVAIGGDANLAPRHSRNMHRHFVKVLQRVDGLLANGQGIADIIRDVVGRECQTAHGVVDLQVFCPSKQRDSLRQELGLPVNQTIVLYAGNLIRERLSANGIKALLVMCGRGIEAEGLRTRIERLASPESVRLVGQIAPTEMHKWMQASDLFVLPSYQEGMPNAVMEAMACGLPVISTRVGGLPGAVGDCAGAILIEPRSVDPLANALLRICADGSLRDRMSLASRETAVARFGVENNAKNTIRYLRGVQGQLRQSGKRISA
jgi:teichuronic acid biosynthesis glycosyltransferase TuaC